MTYFGVVFALAPVAIVTGPAMSPALTNRFEWFARLPGNRQIGRSLHFLNMCAFVVFLVGHVAMVRFLLDRPAPVAEFRREDISPFSWANGKVPACEEWKSLAANSFEDYRLKVYGLVENPIELSLDDLRALGHKTQIGLHHCSQGWSGVAAWGGLPLEELIKLIRAMADARAAVFYSFGEGGNGGEFYDNLSMGNALHPQTLLACEMNFQPLGEAHGAPLRLRVENQLGFKMVKWIRAIEFVSSLRSIGQGEGGYNEDHEYFGELADI